MIFTASDRGDVLKIESAAIQTYSTKYLQIQLWKEEGAWHVSVQHITRGYLGLGAFRHFAPARDYFYFLVDDWSVEHSKVMQSDTQFLGSCGIKVEVEQ